jgi:hypothetical protein
MNFLDIIGILMVAFFLFSYGIVIGGEIEYEKAKNNPAYLPGDTALNWGCFLMIASSALLGAITVVFVSWSWIKLLF